MLQDCHNLKLSFFFSSNIKICEVPTLSDCSQGRRIESLLTRQSCHSKSRAEIRLSSVIWADEEIYAGWRELYVEQRLEVIYPKSP